MPAKNFLPFEKKVLLGLQSCALDVDSVSKKSPLGVAVSGGADSVSLLLSLCAILGSEKVRVITVNHGIRSAEESGGDARFVSDLCEERGIFCKIAEISQGKIAEIAESEKRSVEEVARQFRYEAFENFIKEENLTSLCLAHNQNDQMETLLMRFLQGSVEGAGGIARVRGKCARPLLDIPRTEIEHYLCEKNQTWRTDSTNSDTTYLRNKVRNVLVPVLNEHFAGWQGAVLSGAKKAANDEDFLQELVSESELVLAGDSRNSQKIALERESFFALHNSLKRRVFFSALNKIGFGGRFPFTIFEEVASWDEKKSRNLSFENVTIVLDSERLEISLRDSDSEKSDTAFIESGFSFLIKKCGERAEIGEIVIEAEKMLDSDRANFVIYEKSKSAQNCEKISFTVALPALVRSAIAGDKVKTADGNFKSLSQIFSDWKIPEKVREKIPVIEELFANENGESQIRAVIARPFVAKNWIVEETIL